MASTDRTISNEKSLRTHRLRGSVQKLAGQGPLISCDPLRPARPLNEILLLWSAMAAAANIFLRSVSGEK